MDIHNMMDKAPYYETTSGMTWLKLSHSTSTNDLDVHTQ